MSFAASAAKEPRACAPCSSVRGSWQKRRSISAPPARRLHGGPLARGGPVPVATGSRRPDGKRAAVGEAAQAAETEACSGRQVVQAVAERHRPGRGSAGAGVGERLRRRRGFRRRAEARGPRGGAGQRRSGGSGVLPGRAAGSRGRRGRRARRSAPRRRARPGRAGERRSQCRSPKTSNRLTRRAYPARAVSSFS